MKRVLFGILRFVIFFIVSIFIGAGIVGAMQPDHAQAAGAAFGARFGNLFLLCVLVAAVAGTWFRMLPGTGKPDA